MRTCSDISDLIQEHGINVLLIGFPKCGTTAFADWLSSCPQVDVSSPKETFLLCPEFASNLQRSASRGAEVEACYTPQSEGVLRMEATTLNAYSGALMEAAADLPNVKCIALTRDPVEATLSWHNQVINAGFQCSDDFTESWNHGLELDSQTGQEFLTRYHEVSAHGQWCSRWVERIGHERCLMLRSVDLRDSPKSVKNRLEAFLDTELEVADRPPERNKFSEPRSKFLYDTIRGSSLLRAFRGLEKHLQPLATVRRMIRDKIVLKPSKKKIGTEVESMLRDAFADDQAILRKLAIQNASVWNEI